MHQSIWSFARKRYLWIALALSAISIAAYVRHEPMSPPNGGTWLGYALGSVGAALILWLTALGIRKRRYHSTLGTVQGWVSAHVYLGLSLVVIVTLHSGFQFGWNIHTVAYALMIVVIGSGLFGTVMYIRLPREMSANRASQTRGQMLAELGDLDARALRVAQKLPAPFRDAAQSNRDRTQIGGGLLAILIGADRSQALIPAGNGAASIRSNPDQGALLDWLGAELARSTASEPTQLIGEMISIVAARRVVLRRLRRDAQLRAWLEIWLYVHVPVTLALIAALIAHVVSVFLYW